MRTLSRCAQEVSDDAGQALVLVAVFLLGLVAVVGLATDGGLVFAQRRELQNLADAAALAGAMQIDEGSYRAGGNVALDRAAAQSATAKYLEGAGDVTYRVSVQATGIEVQVSRRASTGFLRVIGVNSVTIGASARAEPRHGFMEAGQ